MWKWTRSFPDQIPIDVERNSLRFPYANWELCRPISLWFWKEFLKDSIWKLTQNSTDKFWIDLERDCLRISCGNSQQISDWLRKEFLKVSTWKLAQISPGHFPNDFERDSLRVSHADLKQIYYTFWNGFLKVFTWKFDQGSTQANFPLILQGYLKESLWNFSLILRRIPQGFHMEFPIDLKGTP